MTKDLRDANQKAISQGLKFAWKRKKANGGWHANTERMTAAEYKATAKPEKRSKYGNRKVVVDGIKFDSQREANRYTALLKLERDGKIRDLVLQPIFILALGVRIDGEARKRPALRYSADFTYVEADTNLPVVEDVKSTPTAKSKEFRRIQHLMQAVHGISIRIVK